MTAGGEREREGERERDYFPRKSRVLNSSRNQNEIICGLYIYLNDFREKGEGKRERKMNLWLDLMMPHWLILACAPPRI